MNILVVYRSTHRERVEELRKDMQKWSSKITVLRVKRGRGWHHDARMIISKADMIVYCVSNDSIASKNVNWELKEAIRQEKGIVCFPLEQGIDSDKLNKCLEKEDWLTKKTKRMYEWVNNRDELKKMVLNYTADGYIDLYNLPHYDTKTLIDQYRLFAQTAENLLLRRQNVNSFYITANTALVSIGATIFGLSGEISAKLWIVLFLALPGILLNISWGKILRSYGINNKAKLKILSMIESRLPVSIYDAEWRVMKNKYSGQKYESFTDGEKILPWVFGAFYVSVSIISIAFLYWFYITAIVIPQ